MLWVRKGIVHFLALVLFVSLLGIAASASLNHTFSKPDNLQKWLAESGIYEKLVPNALDNAQDTDSSVSLDDSQVRQAAQQTFTAEVLRQSVNNFIEGNYNWLQGKTATPDFHIDLTQQKNGFAATVGQLVQDHLSGLPVCTNAQLAQLQLPVDPLTAPCRPATLDPKTEGQRVANDILNGDFLKQPVINAGTVTQNTDNPDQEPYYKQAEQLPKLYRLAQKLPYILGVVALLAGVAVVTMAMSKRQGLRRVGITFALAGAVLIAVKFLADLAVNSIRDKTFTHSLGGELRQPYHKLLQEIESGLTSFDLIFGIVFLLIGAGIITYLILTRNAADRPKFAPKSKSDKSPDAYGAGSFGPSPAPSAAKDEHPDKPGGDAGERLRYTPRPTAPPVKRKPPRLIQ